MRLMSHAYILMLSVRYGYMMLQWLASKVLHQPSAFDKAAVAPLLHLRDWLRADAVCHIA
jgi:hypothetical protein